jgi:hypothetical protein
MNGKMSVRGFKEKRECRMRLETCTLSYTPQTEINEESISTSTTLVMLNGTSPKISGLWGGGDGKINLWLEGPHKHSQMLQ